LVGNLAGKWWQNPRFPATFPSKNWEAQWQFWHKNVNYTATITALLLLLGVLKAMKRRPSIGEHGIYSD